MDTADITLSGSTARCTGRWTAQTLDGVDARIRSLPWPSGAIRIDLSGVDAVDTVGAWLLYRATRDLRDGGRDVSLDGVDATSARLLDLVESKQIHCAEPLHPPPPGFLEELGRDSVDQVRVYASFFEFIGEVANTAIASVLHPRRIRWQQIAHELQQAGVDALPIVGLLSFLLGIVIAYQGGTVLRSYGANIFIVDIVGLAMVRELAPLITAIIVAGRTGSAYTAQIGTMLVTEEVDALRSIGIAPQELLVLPKMIALSIALPLLTVYADVMGLIGGIVMSHSLLGLSTTNFVERLADAVSVKSFLSGVGKAPVFAVMIALVGCFQGFRATGSAEGVGRQTTVSVVQSIFLVIVVDAVFSIAFNHLGI
ncbi:MAG TPA: MlaE family lipid ABC transporter permease subunit [Pseudomonadales bacterium]|nr:MlaE family lipid ABC transporter permease subunit [Pseudomonadales bacterium]